MLDQRGIRRLVALREPALHVDRVLSMSDQDIVTEKAVSVAESCYAMSHRIANFSYPLALILESMAQTCILLAASQAADGGDYIPVIVSMERARQLASVMPGDVMQHRARLIAELGSASIFRCEAMVSGRRAVEVQRLVIALRPGDCFRE